MRLTDSNKSQLDQARECLIQQVDDGLRHGFFDLAVTCETVNGKKRRLTIKAGKNHRFMIPEEEID